MTTDAETRQSKQSPVVNPLQQCSPVDSIPASKLMDGLLQGSGAGHYSHLLKRFVYSYNICRAAEVAEPEIKLFFNYLAVEEADHNAGIIKHVGCYTSRESLFMHLLETGYGISTIMELLGHKDFRTTMIYTMHSTTDAGERHSWCLVMFLP